MRRLLCGPLAILSALWAVPMPVHAFTALGPESDDGEEDLVIIEDEMEGEEPPAADKPAEGEAGAEAGASLDILDEDEGTATPTPPPDDADDGKKSKKEKDSEAKLIKTETKLITVVQRQRMLKKKRIDIQPQIGISVNDPYVRHYAFGGEFRYWLTNRMALGITGTAFLSNLTPRYDNIKIQEGLLLTANRVLWQASLNYQYNPFYGKIAIFNRLLLHWEAYVQLGGGALQTRVVPRFQALHDPYNVFTGGGQFTIGAQFYMPDLDWLSINFGARTWVYPDKLEPLARGFDEDLNEHLLDDPNTARDAASWSVQFNTILFLGLSFYFPPSFEYTTPR